jgi:hypothetical protein
MGLVSISNGDGEWKLTLELNEVLCCLQISWFHNDLTTYHSSHSKRKPILLFDLSWRFFSGK